MRAKFPLDNLCIEKEIDLYIKTLTGKTVTIPTILSGDTVLMLKERIQDKEGIPVDQQRLIFNGVQLEDSRSLSDYDLSDGSTVCRVLNLRGGTLMDLIFFSST